VIRCAGYARVATKTDDGRVEIAADCCRCIMTDRNSKTNGKLASKFVKRPDVVVGAFARDDSRTGEAVRLFLLYNRLEITSNRRGRSASRKLNVREAIGRMSRGTDELTQSLDDCSLSLIGRWYYVSSVCMS
jgi:hypothetical protein